jgi:hypothetical protein
MQTSQRPELEDGLLALYEAINGRLKEGDMDNVAEALFFLSRIKREITELFDQTQAKLVDLMGDEPEITSRNVNYEKKQGAPRKSWNHKDLGQLVADRIVDMSIDMDTGEVMKSTNEMLTQMLTYCGVSYWRVKELNKIGINADRFCEVGEPKTSIIIHANEE